MSAFFILVACALLPLVAATTPIWRGDVRRLSAVFPDLPDTFETPALLKEWLESSNVDLRRWESGDVSELWRELQQGESELRVESKGNFKVVARHLTVLNLRVYRAEGPPNRHLKKERLELSDGTERPRKWPLLSENMLVGENPFEAAERALFADLGRFMRAWKDALPPSKRLQGIAAPRMFSFDESSLEERRIESSEGEKAEGAEEGVGHVANACSSFVYPTLPCVYTLYTLKARVSGLPSKPFNTTEEWHEWGDDLSSERTMELTTHWGWRSDQEEAREEWQTLDTLLFDVDGTLYPPSNGLPDATWGTLYKFMVEVLGVESVGAAKALSDEYFPKYHSDLKGLLMMEADGRLPEGSVFYEDDSAFEGFGDFFVAHTNWSLLAPADAAFREGLSRCAAAGLKLAAVSNSPRKYALKAIETLGLSELFPETSVFGAEEMLPAAKPEADAFKRVLRLVRADPHATALIEDNEENLKAAKGLGMRTVFVAEAFLKDRGFYTMGRANPNIDVSIDGVEDLFKALPTLGYQGQCADLEGLYKGNEYWAARVDGWDEWQKVWVERLDRWKYGLFTVQKENLNACVGALNLFLAQRLGWAYQLWRAGGGAAPPPPAPTSAGQERCEWVSTTDPQAVQMPPVPEFPPFPEEFTLPVPIPALLPKGWSHQLQSARPIGTGGYRLGGGQGGGQGGGGQGADQDARDARPPFGSSFGAGAVSGVVSGLALLSAILGVRRLRRRQSGTSPSFGRPSLSRSKQAGQANQPGPSTR